MSYVGNLGASGDIDIKVYNPRKVNKPSLREMLRFWLNLDFISGWIAVKVIVPAIRLLRLPLMTI